jgi:hypothetical protein
MKATLTSGINPRRETKERLEVQRKDGMVCKIRTNENRRICIFLFEAKCPLIEQRLRTISISPDIRRAYSDRNHHEKNVKPYLGQISYELRAEGDGLSQSKTITFQPSKWLPNEVHQCLDLDIVFR